MKKTDEWLWILKEEKLFVQVNRESGEQELGQQKDNQVPSLAEGFRKVLDA